MKAILASWRRQSVSMRVLRAFLGLTFIYAGWDKVSDPLFITQGFVDSVTAYSQTSPISSLLTMAAERPEIFGWLIIISELAIGAFTLTGAAAFPAAAGGAALSLTLWLSSSWNVRPYFLAADPAYLVMWVVYALSLTRPKKILVIERREAAQAILATAIVGVAAFFGRRNKAIATTDSSHSPAKGETIVALADFPVGSTHAFTSSQGKAIAIRLSETKIVAYTTECTHEGCAVQFDRGRKLLECPCHGATFDPAKDAAPTPPANRPLTKINVAIKGKNVVEL